MKFRHMCSLTVLLFTFVALLPRSESEPVVRGGGDFVPDIESTAWAKLTTEAGATTYYTGSLAFSNAMLAVTNGGTVEYGGSHSWTGAVVRNGGVTNITIIGRPGSLLTAAIADTAYTDYALYLASIPGLRIDGMRLRGVLAAWTAGPTNDYFSYNAIFNSSVGVIRNSTFQFEVSGDGTRGGFSEAGAIHKNVVGLSASLRFEDCDFVTADLIGSNHLAHTAFHDKAAVSLIDCRFLSYGCRRFTESTFRADKDAIIGCTANSDASLAGVRCVHPYSLTNALVASVTNAPDDTGIYQVGEDGAWLVDRKTATGAGETNWTTLVTVSVTTIAFTSVWNQTLNADLYFEQTGGFGQMPLIYSIAYDGNVSKAYTGYLAGATAYSATRIRHLYSTSNICLQARSSTNIQPVRIRGYLLASGINSVVGNDTYTNSLHKTWRVTAP